MAPACGSRLPAKRHVNRKVCKDAGFLPWYRAVRFSLQTFVKSSRIRLTYFAPATCGGSPSDWRPEAGRSGIIVRIDRTTISYYSNLDLMTFGSGRDAEVREVQEHCPLMSLERLERIVIKAVPILFDQIEGGRVVVQSEASLQLHLGRIIATVADLELVSARETFSIELEKPLGRKTGRGRLDIWFRLTGADGREWRCAMELKFFKKASQAEPVNRHKVFLDVARLETCGDVAEVGFLLVATDHPHYVEWDVYSADTADFDFRHGQRYRAGTAMTYRTPGSRLGPITLRNDYEFVWTDATRELRYLLLRVPTHHH